MGKNVFNWKEEVAEKKWEPWNIQMWSIIIKNIIELIKIKLAITYWLDCLNKDVDRKIEKQVRIPRKVEWYRHLVLLCWLQIRYCISVGLSLFLLFTPPRGVCNSVAWSDGLHCLISKVSYFLKEIFHFIYSTGLSHQS